MRARVFIIVLAILLVAGFAAQNWPEFQRTQPLLFGVAIVDAPLGLILLGVLGVTLVAFLLASAASQTRSLMESRHHHKELERQRELADRAEASRFTELRHHLDTQLKELRQRDGIAATELEKVRLETQRELRNQLESMNRLLATRLNEIEHRLDAHFGGSHADAPVLRDRVGADPLRRERV